MYEEFYGFARTPFSRDIPPKDLYQSSTLSETLGRLFYVAERQLFCVLTGECGTGKTTAVRRFKEELDGSKYTLMYIADSKLTPRNFYKGILDQLGAESKFYRGVPRGSCIRKSNL